MSGISWTFKENENCKFGYGWEENEKIRKLHKKIARALDGEIREKTKKKTLNM